MLIEVRTKLQVTAIPGRNERSVSNFSWELDFYSGVCRRDAGCAHTVNGVFPTSNIPQCAINPNQSQTHHLPQATGGLTLLNVGLISFAIQLYRAGVLFLRIPFSSEL